MRLGDSYFWIRFNTPAESLEWDQFQLFENGALGTEEEVSPGEIGPDSSPEEKVLGAAPAEVLPGMKVVLKATFADAQSLQSAVNFFSQKEGLEWGEAINEDWDRSWREQQLPVVVTPQLTVVPPWVESPLESSPYLIRLEAKRAFGTGQHESTQLAAELLEKMGESPSPLNGKRILDIGTGTGILAIYAALLGAKVAVGFDIDVVAGPCLRENSGLNPTPRDHQALWFVGTTDALKQPTDFEVVICNMIRTEWWPFRGEIVKVTHPTGEIIISGQRIEDQDKVKPWLVEAGLSITAELERQGWWAFRAKRI